MFCEAHPRFSPIAHRDDRFPYDHHAATSKNPGHFAKHHRDVWDVVETSEAGNQVKHVVWKRHNSAGLRFDVLQWNALKVSVHIGIRRLKDGDAVYAG